MKRSGLQPDLADVLIGCEAFEGFEPSREVVGGDEARNGVGAGHPSDAYWLYIDRALDSVPAWPRIDSR